jgi:transposase
VLVEAAWSVIQHPGPLRGFYERMRARRGHGKAIVAVARKLAVLFWCLLRPRPGLRPPAAVADRQKLRRAEITAGAPTQKGKQTGVFATRERMRHAERELAQQAEASYTRMVCDCQAARPQKTKPAEPRQGGRERDSGARTTRPSKGNIARQTTSP